MTVYLDCNATTPVEPRVREIVFRYLSEEYGNEGSRTHDFGARAKQAVQLARGQVADVVRAKREEVVFTSGATESNNLAILGLADYGLQSSRRHIVSTQIEHKAVLEPLEELERRGFEVTLVKPNRGGWVEPERILEALRPNTLLVSVMHVNNETGVKQPIPEIAKSLSGHEAYFHVDAAQSFGKEIDELRIERIDLISISGHKIFAPKGIGALITRKRGFRKVPLKPLFFGGGQERCLRPGTLPVPLIAGLGEAARIACSESQNRQERCQAILDEALEALAPLSPIFNGDASRRVQHTLNVSFQGVDSEALMVALKDIAAISNGSACTSHSYQPSHVLKAMGLETETIQSAVRISWCHLTDQFHWNKLTNVIKGLR